MPIFGFLFGSRIGMIITAVVVFSGVFFSWLAIHDNAIWNKATEAFNQQQAEVLQKKEEEFKQQTTVIDENAARIRAAINKQQEIENNTTAEIEKKAVVETKGTTNESSPYLKSIIKQLNNTYGEKKK